MRYCSQLLNHPLSKISEEAYVTICDSLIVYSKNLSEKEGLKPLVYEPDKGLQKQLSNFLEDKVFLDDDDDGKKKKKRATWKISTRLLNVLPSINKVFYYYYYYYYY